ncbi:hypothetical protein FBU30_002078 [Linnemannia zychae]|nr:hypothetical protein FBU30_002078 [Linnemannia zychae]
MTRDVNSTDPCSRNSAKACLIRYATIPPVEPYYTLGKVIEVAKRPNIDDDSFKAEIQVIRARYPLPTNGSTSQDDEESSDSLQGSEDDGEQGSEEEGSVLLTHQDILQEMREITERQKRDASRMQELIEQLTSVTIA